MKNEVRSQPSDPLTRWQHAADKGTFEEVYTSLEEVVAHLEQGGLPLDTSLAYYELGVLLGERCAQLLEQAELRVSYLERRDGFGLADEDWPDIDDAGA